jgi:hypothetical protein
MDKIRDIFSYFVAAMAMFALLGAVYQAFHNEKGSAVTLGTLFLVGALIVFLPQVEFIKTLGVEARLRQTVTEAVATLENLKRLSQISARASYLTIAWGNRFGGPPAKEKQAVLDQIDSQLSELEVSPEDRAVITRPFVKMVRLDFFWLFRNVLEQYAALVSQRLQDNVHSAPDSSAASALVLRHSDIITAWKNRMLVNEPSADLERRSLAEEIKIFMPKSGEWLSDKDIGVIDAFAKEIIRMNAECEKKGGYTPEAVEFYDRYSERAIDKASELWATAGK